MISFQSVAAAMRLPWLFRNRKIEKEIYQFQTSSANENGAEDDVKGLYTKQSDEASGHHV